MMACHLKGQAVKRPDRKRSCTSRMETLRRKAVRANKACSVKF